MRSGQQLYEDQMALLERYRREQEQLADVGQLPTSGGHVGPGVWGQVSEVVGSDPQYGAHLVVQPQKFVGIPPVAQDAEAAVVRCYPAPGRTVSDYAVDEYVKVMAARGAFVADKSA